MLWLPKRKSAGTRAEHKVKKFLIDSGHTILATNYKTKQFELDIITKYQKVLYIIEVKHRQTEEFGTGLEYITRSKIRQLTKGANHYANQINWDNDIRLLVISTAGDDFDITESEELEL